MIFLNWFVFVWSLYVMVIILINFLIAVIGSSYEETEATSESFKYQQRSEVNTEASIYKKYQDNRKGPEDTYLGFCILSKVEKHTHN